MKIFRKLTTKILVLSSIFIAFTVSLFCILILDNLTEPKQSINSTEVYKDFCGTKKLSDAGLEGKQIFNNTCAPCHKLTAKMIGPSLRNIDSIKFRKWLYWGNSRINVTKLDQLGIDYHHNLSKSNFTVSDLEKIYAYIGR